MIEKQVDNIFNRDCVEGMKELPADSVDLVITDPPFAIDFKTHRSNYIQAAVTGQDSNHGCGQIELQ